MLHVAEIVGAFALASARRIVGVAPVRERPVLSKRQRECVLWSARGKSQAEIAAILGISEETVNQHLRTARDRYAVHCRQALILCALFDGLIGFGDIIRWARPARSEEHTSELQSLMRISYAVFCLKKKNTKYQT